MLVLLPALVLVRAAAVGAAAVESGESGVGMMQRQVSLKQPFRSNIRQHNALV